MQTNTPARQFIDKIKLNVYNKIAGFFLLFAAVVCKMRPAEQWGYLAPGCSPDVQEMRWSHSCCHATNTGR